MIFYLWNFDFD